MKRVVKWTTVLLVVLMATSGAWAFDEAFHVKKANDNKGDLLFVPGYFTSSDGWETKLTVINTHPVYSVVAKVVYRSHYWTKELLDHLIYLSPRDVWVGTIKQVGGKVVINCKDDSMLAANGVFANTQEVNQPFFTQNICSNDSADRGYVEILETWFGDTYNYGSYITVSGDNTRPGIDKKIIANLYPPTPPVAGYPPPGLDSAGNDAHLIDHTINVLTGFFEIQNPNFPGMTSALEMMVYSDFDINEYLNVGVVSGMNSYTGRNTIGELEAAMSKDLIAMPYVNRTGEAAIHFFNFPTKMSTDSTYCVYDTEDLPSGAGDFWRWYSDMVVDEPLDQCLTYSYPFFDLSENELTSDNLYSGGTVQTFEMCEELEMKVIQNSPYFAEGWVEYDFDNSFMSTMGGIPFEPEAYEDGVLDFTYVGFPVQPFVLYIKNVGVNMFYPAWDDGMVYGGVNSTRTYAPTAIPDAYLYDYQSFNRMSPLGLNDETGMENSGIVGIAAYPSTVGMGGTLGVPPYLYFGITSPALNIPVQNRP